MRCRTNLDLDHCEKWPAGIPQGAIPRVGDIIESAHEWPDRSRLQLEVYRVTWKFVEDSSITTTNYWEPELNLHLPKGRWESLTQFYEWYGKITGRGKSAFI